MNTRSILKIGVAAGFLGMASMSLAAEGIWTRKAGMPTARFCLATSVVDGKIYAIGGSTGPGIGISSVEEYNPTTDTWTKKANMPTARICHSTSVADEIIYAIGGATSQSGSPVLTVGAYDPATDTWATKAPIPTARGFFSASVVNRRIYAIGGCAHPYNANTLSIVDAYDPATDTWTKMDDMPTPRKALATSAVNGKIYAIGGNTLRGFETCISTVEEYNPNPLVADFNGDGMVDFTDLSRLFECWLQNERSVDIGPTSLGDGIVDFKDMAVFAEYWVEEILYIKWLGHASIKIWTEDAVVYVDPRSLSESPHDATLVLVTHTHGDHYQPGDIAKVSNSETKFIAPPDVVQQYGQGQAIAPGQTIISGGVPVTAVPAYNTNKPNHPKSNNWVGFIIELGGKRTYVAGDTDLIPEMQTLGKIDVAFLPAGGTYTMNATEAAQAATIIDPTLAIPYHWGTSVGTLADAQAFASLARCAVKILAVGETISSDNWPVYSPLIAHWKLDEIEGNTAHDSADDHDGTLHGSPDWQPDGGNTDGSLQFDGVNDYISTDFVLNPADGAFSVFAWVRGSVPGQVVISQTDGTGTGATWLGTESSQGKLMTDLIPPQTGRFPTPPLVSEFVITDDQWRHIGLVWDGSHRYLYVDGTEVAKDADALDPLKSSDGGLHIGAGRGLEAASFWLGLIDEVRIYNQALDAEEIGELAN